MTERWVPGADPVYMAYDPRDRLVMTQDGAQRNKSPREWKVIKYDAYDRPIITGLLSDPYGWSLSFVQSYINSFYINLAAGKSWYEERGTDMHGYTNKSYPDQLLPTECLMIIYYDDYEFKNAIRKPSDYKYLSTEIAGMPANNSIFVKGEVTGSKVRVLDGEAYTELQWLTTYHYYDDKYRLVQSVTDNYKGGWDRTSILSDFSGKPTKSKVTHINRAATWTNFANAAMEGNKVIKKTGAANTWDASATSLETLPASTNGWVEISASEEWNYRMFGFGTQNPNGNPSLVNYGLILQAGGTLVKAELGLYTSVGTYCSGDTLRIERNGSQIIYKKNGTQLTAPTTGAVTTALNAVSVFYSTTASIAYTKLSFGNTTMVLNGEAEYDKMGRPTNTWHQVNSNTKYLISRINYNALGQPIEKRLHSTNATATDAKETIAYTYNVRGWLNGINDPTTNPRLFAMALKYNDPTASGGTAEYGGNISEMIWKSGGSYKQSYGYYYDTLNRLKDGRYFNLDVTTRNGRFTETIGGVNAKGYDLNGNILKMTRSGMKGLGSFGIMDNLTYTYFGNQITRVDDAIAMNVLEVGFKELAKTANEYVYDKSGSMIADQNKGITGISYSYLNLPRKVTKSATDYINYVYDATGRKLFQQTFTATSSKRVDYAGMLTYQNDSLKMAVHGEGRVILTSATPEYQYNLKDHLGNVRVTFTTQNPSTQYAAGFESANQSGEANNFQHYPSGGGQINTIPINARTGTNSQYLNGGYAGQVGVTKSFSVMPGDVVQIDAYAKYNTPSGTPASYTNFVASLLSAFNLTAPVAGEVGTAAAGISSFGAWEIGPTGDASKGDPVKVFVTIILFDRNYNFIDVAYMASTSSGALMSKSYTVKEPGYAYLYVSNEHPTLLDIYFDDITVTYKPSAVVATNDYYPFGLTFNSYSRESSVPNAFLFQEKEKQKDLDLNLYDFSWRQYDPALGRTTTPDPMADFFVSVSPYSFLLNNPVSFIDPTGMQTTTPDPNKPDPDPVVDFGTLAEIVVEDTRLPPIGFSTAGLYPNPAPGFSLTGFLGSDASSNNQAPEKRATANTASANSPAAETRDEKKYLVDGTGQILNIGGVFWGASELALQGVRKMDGNNGAKFIARSSLSFGFGTQKIASALKGTLGHVKNVSSKLGTIGYAVSVYSYGDQLLSGKEITTATHVNFGISTALYGAAVIFGTTAAAPWIAGAAVVYGVVQLGSYIYNGKTIEENIAGDD